MFYFSLSSLYNYCLLIHTDWTDWRNNKGIIITTNFLPSDQCVMHDAPRRSGQHRLYIPSRALLRFSKAAALTNWQYLSRLLEVAFTISPSHQRHTSVRREKKNNMSPSENEFNIPAKNCHRMVILGSTKVGKTAIISRFLNKKVEDQYTPTIEDFHRKLYSIRGDVYQLDILDTSGNHPFPAMMRLSILTGKLNSELTKQTNVFM